MATRKTRKEDKVEKSPFSTGRRPKSGGTSGIGFVSLGDGESVTFAPLVSTWDMVSADMHEHWQVRPAKFHPCISDSDECPSCEIGHETRWKGYLPIMTKDEEVQILPLTSSVSSQIEELEDELGGDISGYLIKLSRRGGGLSTRYSVIGLGRKVDISKVKEIPDFLPSLGPTTRSKIIELLEEGGVVTSGYFGDGESVPFDLDEDLPEISSEVVDEDEDLSDWDEV